MPRIVSMFLMIVLSGAFGGETAEGQVDALDELLVQRARAILDEVPLIDGHNDVPWTLRRRTGGRLATVDLRADTGSLEPAMHTDIPRLRQGGVGAQFWSVYVPVSYEGPRAVQAVLEQIDLVHRMARRYPTAFEIATTAEDIVRIHGDGRIASLIGIEGGHCIGNSLGVLRQLHHGGARYMTLTHSSNTDWADAATDDPEHDGLSPFGREVVLEMARLGMLIDLSHVSPKTMNDVLDITPVPVIFSHSSARALTDHPRNVPDEVLERLPENEGVVMVTFVPSFVSEPLREFLAERAAVEARLKSLYPGQPETVVREMDVWRESHPVPRASLRDVADHIDHIRDIAGIDHIGIGSDFDGIGSTPLGLEGVQDFPNLFAELLARGYSEDDLKKIAGLNVLRVMRRVETVARALQKTSEPSEALFDGAETAEE